MALLLWQSGDRRFKVAQLQHGDRVRLDGQHRGHFLDRDIDAFANRAPHVIDMLVVQDREQPGAQIRAGLPQMLFGDGAGQAALDEIVGACHIPGQRARIAA